MQEGRIEHLCDQVIAKLNDVQPKLKPGTKEFGDVFTSIALVRQIKALASRLKSTEIAQTERVKHELTNLENIEKQNL